MPDIKVLDSHIADLIAAGEVVERPASVAKELMENAIDAGAHKVTVEIAHGGLTFLRVTDDGCGIPADQLKTAFLRHATSKLRTEYDLEAIGTLGFRGEALAAIAAVSRLEVISRTQDAPLGASLSLEGGVVGQLEEAGGPVGTTMVVRDLFYNTPARLKFMKKDAAEGAAVFAVVQRVALSHPEVSVKFIRDGKQELLTPGDGQLKSAVYAVLGRELALGFREVKSQTEDMTVTGFVSLPACCRGSRNWQYFFVNGRQVKSRLMMAALEEAYQNQKMVGKFPACVLHLETKLNAVDVNVHPAKTEVKFGGERQVFSAVYHAVLSALTMDRSHPTMELKEAPAAKPAPAPVVERTIRPNVTVFSRPKPQMTSTIRLNDTTAPQKLEQEKKPQPLKEEEPERKREPVLPAISKEVKQQPVHKEETISTPIVEVLAPTAEENLPEPLLVEEVSTNEPAIVEENIPETQQELAVNTQSWRMAGEVLNTYIVVEQGESVFFIDKHAAHERINFDRMKAQGYDPMAQSLLVPVVCKFSPQEQQALLEQTSLLEEFGFEVEELGRDLVVRQAPFDVELGEIENTLTELAQKLLSGGRADPAAARDELLHTMACKAAIKGGWETTPQELDRVARAVMSGQVKYCPHGRPVAIELTKKELEKQFKRS